MNAFSVAKLLIEATERRLLRANEATWPISWIRREFVHPFAFVFCGLEFFIQNWVKTILYPGIFVLLTTYIASQANVGSELLNVMNTVALILGVSVILFAMPSSFTHVGISDEDVKALALLIENRVSCEPELHSVRANLEILEEGAKDRVKALSWALGTAWAGALLCYNQFIGISTKLVEHNRIGELIGGSLTFVFGVGFLALISLTAIIGYRKANAMVFRGLQFACNQASIRLCAQTQEDEAGS